MNEEAESALSVLRCGLKHFAKDQGYILSFAEFLLGLNDFENARILLENGIQMIGEDDCPALWEKLLLIESQYSMSPSSLGDIVKVSVGVFLHGIVAEAVLQRESQETIITRADQLPVSLQRIQRMECV